MQCRLIILLGIFIEFPFAPGSYFRSNFRTDDADSSGPEFTAGNFCLFDRVFLWHDEHERLCQGQRYQMYNLYNRFLCDFGPYWMLIGLV